MLSIVYFRVVSVRLASTLLKPGAVILMNVDEYGIPHFGLINELFVDSF